MALRFEGQLNEKDFRNAIGVYYRPGRGNAILRLALILLLLAAAAYLSTSGEAAFLLLGGVLLGFVLLVAFPWLIKFSPVMKRTFEQRPDLQRPMKGFITTEKVVIQAGETHSEHAWRDYLYYQEGKGVVLLFLAKTRYNVFPRGYFASDADWTAFLHLVHQQARRD